MAVDVVAVERVTVYELVVVDFVLIVELVVMVGAVLIVHHHCHLQRGVVDHGHSYNS